MDNICIVLALQSGLHLVSDTFSLRKVSWSLFFLIHLGVYQNLKQSTYICLPSWGGRPRKLLFVFMCFAEVCLSVILGKAFFILHLLVLEAKLYLLTRFFHFSWTLYILSVLCASVAPSSWWSCIAWFAGYWLFGNSDSKKSNSHL